MPELPIFGPFPAMSTMVGMVIFTMMALGLNFVVGYAGLLDLGYVAFYAMGAYMAGWFASSQFANQNLNFGAVGALSGRDGLPLLDLARPADGRHRDGGRRRAHRPADAAPARRLPRDRDARLRRDHAADRAQRRQPVRRSTSRTGRAGSRRSTGPGFGSWADQHLHLPANYLNAANSDNLLLLDGARARPAHDLHERAAARLASRPRVGRDPRGRDRRVRDGRSADADEDLGVRDGRVLRRCRRRVLRELQERRVPRRLLLQHLGLHPLHGDSRRDGEHLGRDLRRMLPLVPRPRGARQRRRVGQRPLRHAHRRAALRVRDLRPHPRGRDALPARGPDPELRDAQPSSTRACTTRRCTTWRSNERRRCSRPIGSARSSAASSRSTTSTSSCRERDRQPHRAERRRQDDVLQHADRRLQADRGPRDLRRRGHDRQAAARVHAARDRSHVPEHPPVPEHDGARERARRHARTAEGQPVRGALAHAARAARGEGGPRPRARAARVLRPQRVATT